MTEPVHVVAIVGSRGYPFLTRVDEFVDKLAAKYPDAIVVSGNARGVDRRAEQRALLRGLGLISYRVVEFRTTWGRKLYTIQTLTVGERAQEIVVAKHRRINPPTFKTFGRAATHRNGWIAEDSERTVAFWDGHSYGTHDSIVRAEKLGHTTHVFGA